MGRREDWRDAAAIGRYWLAILSLVLLPIAPAVADDELLDMSLEELMNIEVTSVSKKAESRNDTAAAITVITAEDIRRGGFTTIPEALRVVPGVQVSRIDARRWAISIRGFRQEFSNKLLVLIDGRPVYTPLFGGVVWSEQNLAMADVERIEVVRGPGGVVWGANAVNGVVNIITKDSADTLGGLVQLRGGTQQYGATGRYGARLSEDTTLRVTAKGDRFEDFDFNQNYNGNDEWQNLRLGVRSDSAIDEDAKLEMHLDYWDIDGTTGFGVRNPAPPFQVQFFSDIHQRTRGGAVLLNYERDIDEESSIQFKTSFDLVDRRTNLDERSYNFEAGGQYNREICEGVSLVSGLDYRYWDTRTNAITTAVALDPNDDDFHLGSGFVQFEADFFDRMLTLIAGTKLSVNSWSGFEYQPSGRFVLRPVEGNVVWGAVSRAVRTPTAIDNDLNAFIGPVNVVGDRGFNSEELLSVELGYRFFALDWMTFETTAFYSNYDDISSFSGPPPVGPFLFSNATNVEVAGAEFELGLQPTDAWRVTLGYSYLKFTREDGPASPLDGGALNRIHPKHQVVLRSVYDITKNLEFDGSIYYVDGLGAVTPTLRSNNVRQYVRLDLRLGWKPTDWLELSFVGQNLLDPRHAEYNDVQGNQSTQVPRSGYVEATFDF